MITPDEQLAQNYEQAARAHRSYAGGHDTARLFDELAKVARQRPMVLGASGQVFRGLFEPQSLNFLPPAVRNERRAKLYG